MSEIKKFELDKRTHKRYSDFIKKYYPKTAVKGLFGFNSEYNDEGYDYRPGYMIAFDVEGNEVVPYKEFTIKAREDIDVLGMPYAYDYDNQWTEDGQLADLPDTVPFEVLP